MERCEILKRGRCLARKQGLNPSLVVCIDGCPGFGERCLKLEEFKKTFGFQGNDSAVTSEDLNQQDILGRLEEEARLTGSIPR